MHPRPKKNTLHPSTADISKTMDDQGNIDLICVATEDFIWQRHVVRVASLLTFLSVLVATSSESVGRNMSNIKTSSYPSAKQKSSDRYRFGVENINLPSGLVTAKHRQRTRMEKAFQWRNYSCLFIRIYIYIFVLNGLKVLFMFLDYFMVFTCSFRGVMEVPPMNPIARCRTWHGFGRCLLVFLGGTIHSFGDWKMFKGSSKTTQYTDGYGNDYMAKCHCNSSTPCRCPSEASNFGAAQILIGVIVIYSQPGSESSESKASRKRVG